MQLSLNLKADRVTLELSGDTGQVTVQVGDQVITQELEKHQVDRIIMALETKNHGMDVNPWGTGTWGGIRGNHITPCEITADRITTGTPMNQWNRQTTGGV